ncbi:MAG: DUF4386 domain-containing protein [Proteobacteria bacterium]|nr:DUF4386 domain-containing protein [Pseudomonadota bacterium]MBU1583698.1 DUF4386 domain-containing protein [Pseudomonadota bacterium]MBU2453860.1 DUF4386 domain-containing protein [Pseudomonadota bacterium]MBU2629964.1 DUF4386 domain-containing protein [Pseudomonadota bacterium]
MNSIKKTARAAGFLYLLMIIFSVFSLVFIPSAFIVSGDVAKTVNNITNAESLFRLGIVGGLINQVIFVLLVLFLYRLFKPVNEKQALLMLIFVLIGVPIAMLNELNYSAVLLLSSSTDNITVLTADQSQSLINLFLDLHEHGIIIAEIFWGLWLLPLGFLVFKSGFLPKILGILLIIGCFGYLIEVFQFFIFPTYKVITYPGFAVDAIAELSLAFWLLLKGVNITKENENL